VQAPDLANETTCYTQKLAKEQGVGWAVIPYDNQTSNDKSRQAMTQGTAAALSVVLMPLS